MAKWHAVRTKYMGVSNVAMVWQFIYMNKLFTFNS